MRSPLLYLLSLFVLSQVVSPLAHGQDDLPGGEWEGEQLEFKTSIFPASVIGTDGPDIIEISYDEEGAFLEGKVSGLTAFRLPFDYCNGDQEASSMEPRVIRVFAGDGEDQIRVEMPYSQCPCEILGGPGADHLEVNGCTGGNVHGNSGDDTIEVKEHNIEMQVYGDSGDDRVEIEDITSTWVDRPTT